MFRTPLLDREIWKLELKNKNQKPKNNITPPNNIDSPIDQRNFKDDQIMRFASESAKDEFQAIELPIIVKEFNKWLKKNPSGTWKEFYNLYTKISLLDRSTPPWDRPEDYEDEIIEVSLV